METSPLHQWLRNQLTGGLTFTLSPPSWSCNLKISHLFSCDSSASTWGRLCKVSFKWDIHHLQSGSFACQRLSHSSTWDVNKDNGLDFHIDLVDLRTWITLRWLFPDSVSFYWLCRTQHFLLGCECLHLWVPPSFLFLLISDNTTKDNDSSIYMVSV
jgi:hypothetical protein